MQVGFLRPAPDAPAQLMQLGQSELFGVFYHHQGRVGHVHAHLDHGGRQQDLGLAGPKRRHHLFLFLAVEPAVQKPHLPGRENFFQMTAIRGWRL